MLTSFSSIQILSITLVLSGIFFLFISILKSREVQRFVPLGFSLKWRILTLLICFFLFGYIGYILIRLTDISFPLELLTASVFLGGSLFVYGVIDLSKTTIRRLYEGKESLEAVVKERTSELTESNTRLKLSREKYQKQTNFLESTLDALSHPFYVIDANNYKIILHNKASGFDGKKEHTCFQLTHNRDSPCEGEEHPCPLVIIKETGKPVVVDHIHKDHQGNDLHVEVHGYPIFNSKGDLAQVIEYTQDVTDKKVIEIDLVTAKLEAEKANHFKGQFLANISHEIRTPMNAILGMTELALATKLTNRQQHYLETVKESSGLLLNLINDILDFSKIEAGGLQLDERPFCVDEVIATVIRPMRHIAKEKGIRIKVDFKEDVSKKIYLGDDLRLQQILYNLIGNSVKFTHHGTIDIICSFVEQNKDEVVLQFAIKDSGIGIAEEYYNTIFESFNQADKSITRQYGGTGLGLAICKLLVELMGGRIWLESRLGFGSTFSFTSQFKVGDSLHTNKTVSEVVDFTDINPLKILVVDDIAPNRDLVRMILEQENHTVEEASNGLEALQKMAESDYDSVLMDVQMPVMDGLKAARFIRRCERERQFLNSEEEHGDLLLKLSERIEGQHISLLALTAYAMNEDKKRCLDSGMDSYISKPFQKDEILRELAMISRNR